MVKIYLILNLKSSLIQNKVFAPVLFFCRKKHNICT
jgi:hypothetical protein